MGYVTKLQVIKRANDTRQFCVICPSPLAQALEMKAGEELEWVVEDRNTLTPVGTAHLRPKDVPTRQHIHVVVRTPNGNDYGKDLLRQHLEAHPH